MKSNKINYVMVGAFIIAMAVALVATIVTLSGGHGATDEYHAFYRNVTGVKYGTQVLFEGYPIGQVNKVTPVPEGGGMRFRVDFAVRRGWRIPSDSVAAIEAPSLLSAVVIAIAEGTSPTPLKPGDVIHSREAANLFSTMTSVADQIRQFTEQDLRPLMVTLNATLTTVNDIMGTQGKVLVSRLSGLTADLADRVPKIVDEMQGLAGQMQKTAGEVDKLFSARNRQTVEEVLAETRTTVDNLAEFSKNLHATRARLDRMLEALNAMVADNRPDVTRSIIDLRQVLDSVAQHIDSLNQNMEGASRNLYEFSRQIRQNPALLLGSRPPRGPAAGGGR